MGHAIIAFLLISSLVMTSSSVNVDMGECTCNCGAMPGTLSSHFIGPVVGGKFYESIRGQKGEMGRPGEVGAEGARGDVGEIGERGPPAVDKTKNQPGAVTAPSCADIRAGGSSVSGIYAIKPTGWNEDMQVYCDMTTAGGGWTLVASIHENNIYGKCTLGDNWSSDQGLSERSKTGLTNWENVNTFGFAEGATSGDYKSPAYFALASENVMVWHVPNDSEMSQWNTAAFLQYYTTNGFLSSYGGTLQSMYSKYFPLRKLVEKDLTSDGVQRLTDLLRNSAPDIRNRVRSFYTYNYDGGSSNNYISDGGNDMYDTGNRVYYRIGNKPYVQITYEQEYIDMSAGVQIYSIKTHPFIMLMWIANPSGTQESFEIKVSSGTGADNSGSHSSYNDRLTQGNLTCEFQAYNVYGTSDPSICEVYFCCYNPALWNSVPPSSFSRNLWSSGTDGLNNAVLANGSPQSILMGYTLLSKSGGAVVFLSEVQSALRTMMADIFNVPRIPDPNCSRVNDSLVVPVEYIRGDNSTVSERLPPDETHHSNPGFLQFRAIDTPGNPTALCPGVKSLSCNPQYLCVGGIGIGVNSTEVQRQNCGDFSGWAGKSTDNATATVPSGSARPLDDLRSSILIFTR